MSREIAEAHAEALLLLSADMSWETWSIENFLIDLPEKWERSLIVFEGQHPVAYAIISRKPHSIHLHHLIVGRAHRGSGIGEKLLDAAVDQARLARLPLTLKVHESNVKAIGFYRRHGLHPGERQDNGYINMSLPVNR